MDTPRLGWEYGLERKEGGERRELVGIHEHVFRVMTMWNSRRVVRLLRLLRWPLTRRRARKWRRLHVLLRRRSSRMRVWKRSGRV